MSHAAGEMIRAEIASSKSSVDTIRPNTGLPPRLSVWFWGDLSLETRLVEQSFGRDRLNLVPGAFKPEPQGNPAPSLKEE